MESFFSYLSIMKEIKTKIIAPQVNVNVEGQAQNQEGMRRHSVHENHPQQFAANLIKSLVVVVACFFVSITPFAVIRSLKSQYGHSIIPQTLATISTLFWYTSSVVNPFIYVIFRKEFRCVFKNIIKRVCCCCKNQNGEAYEHSGPQNSARIRMRRNLEQHNAHHENGVDGAYQNNGVSTPDSSQQEEIFCTPQVLHVLPSYHIDADQESTSCSLNPATI